MKKSLTYLLVISSVFASCYPTKNVSLEPTLIPDGEQKTIYVYSKHNNHDWIENELIKGLLDKNYQVLSNTVIRQYPDTLNLRNNDGLGQLPRQWTDVQLGKANESELILLIEGSSSVRFVRDLNLSIVERESGLVQWVTTLGEQGRTYKIEKVKPLFLEALQL